MRAALGRIGDGAVSITYAAASVTACAAAGYIAAAIIAPQRGARMLPWLLGRSLGLAAYVALTALTALGVWIRHPWRFRFPVLHPETRLRVHATLAAATVVIIIGHLAALALDRYAGVGWAGAFLPGRSHYRPAGVALGIIAFYAIVVIGATARLAGRLGGRHWLDVHRLAGPAWAMTWFHGVLAGTDAASLRLLYAGSGVAMLALFATRLGAERTTPAPARLGAQP